VSNDLNKKRLFQGECFTQILSDEISNSVIDWPTHENNRHESSVLISQFTIAMLEAML